MRKYDNQKGRSMIEMLGVLAIVGVLSVAGIAGYSKAMGKYKINKVMDQVSTIAANVKTMFASTGSYADLLPSANKGTETAVALGLIPEEMTKGSGVRNGMNGATEVGPTTDTTVGLGFYIAMDGLTKDACTALVTSEWGGSSGFKYMKVSGTALAATELTPSFTASGKVVTPGMSASSLLSQATDTVANGGCGDTNTILWVFY